MYANKHQTVSKFVEQTCLGYMHLLDTFTFGSLAPLKIFFPNHWMYLTVKGEGSLAPLKTFFPNHWMYLTVKGENVLSKCMYRSQSRISNSYLTLNLFHTNVIVTIAITKPEAELSLNFIKLKNATSIY